MGFRKIASSPEGTRAAARAASKGLDSRVRGNDEDARPAVAPHIESPMERALPPAAVSARLLPHRGERCGAASRQVTYPSRRRRSSSGTVAPAEWRRNPW